ncbi:GreA/GreB family elongation factor [Salinimicrobium sp. GXAS 041]|uniref:GreA/GreB family elongation factor n=1 Tax=Salinimicrobium sp. GXAS 041 TaxID=3400806 RepID=UPI003C744FF0
MKYKKLILEKKEYELLKRIISMSQFHRDKSYRASIEKLSDELKTAKIVSNKKMPDDVIRINSTVTIETPWNVKRSYQIVTPERSGLKQSRISVLAPMGLALFGYAKGDQIEWQFPRGINIIKILDVAQMGSSVKLEEI